MYYTEIQHHKHKVNAYVTTQSYAFLLGVYIHTEDIYSVFVLWYMLSGDKLLTHYASSINNQQTEQRHTHTHTDTQR